MLLKEIPLFRILIFFFLGSKIPLHPMFKQKQNQRIIQRKYISNSHIKHDLQNRTTLLLIFKLNSPIFLKRVYCVQYNLPHPLLKVTMSFEWTCGMPLCQNPFSSPLCVCVCFSKKTLPYFFNHQKTHSKFLHIFSFFSFFSFFLYQDLSVSFVLFFFFFQISSSLF